MPGRARLSVYTVSSRLPGALLSDSDQQQSALSASCMIRLTASSLEAALRCESCSWHRQLSSCCLWRTSMCRAASRECYCEQTAPSAAPDTADMGMVLCLPLAEGLHMLATSNIVLKYGGASSFTECNIAGSQHSPGVAGTSYSAVVQLTRDPAAFWLCRGPKSR